MHSPLLGEFLGTMMLIFLGDGKVLDAGNGHATATVNMAGGVQ